ncbi:D-alanyl-D-alanine carboxypeptidase family protein [Motilibacter deserti]|uniref:D-alanyl-D-alanine carboxypeptidase family protein n=1 Tax=Motilibacter deserti TaxID=2714956 RepID=UPI002F2B4164
MGRDAYGLPARQARRALPQVSLAVGLAASVAATLALAVPGPAAASALPAAPAPAPTAGGGLGDVTGGVPVDDTAPKPSATASPSATPKPAATPKPGASPQASASAKPGATPSAGATPSPGATATPGATASPGATPTPAATPAVPVLSPEQAAELAREVNEGTVSLETATARLAELLKEARRALEAHAAAKKTASDARADDADARKKLAAAQKAADGAQTELNRFAADAYRAGPLGTRGSGLGALLSADNPSDFLRGAADIDVLADAQAASLDALQDAIEGEKLAAKKADATAKTAAETAATEKAAKAKADELVARQRTVVSALQAKLLSTGTTDQLAQALSVAEQRRRTAALQKAQAIASGQAVLPDAGAVGCTGEDVSGYPNGQLPLTALCSIWGAPGHLLRADAAAAFSAMSKAYAAVFGSPICMTDSYRNRAMQEDLYVRKPTLAAIPGTSNHGWGVAVDLCDGVENFGTPQHEWLVLNAATYGWYHPAWAEASGSRPEPWHWEYGG